MNTSMKPASRLPLQLMQVGILALACISSASQAIPLSDRPIFLSPGAEPNVFFEVDDSGSMDWEILTVKHWYACEYDPNHPDDVYNFSYDVCDALQYPGGVWKAWPGTGSGSEYFEYIYPNADNAYSNGCTSGRETLLLCGSPLSTNPVYARDWRILSSDFNVVYYNPEHTYQPWDGPCQLSGALCTDASFSAARSDPREGTSGYSLTRNLDGFIYEVWEDDRGYSGSRPYRGNEVNVTATANGEIDLWDKHTQYLLNGSQITVTTTTYSPDATGLNPTTSSQTLSGTACFTELAGGGKSCRTISEVKQNIANWYQYARRRSFVAKSAIASVIDDNPNFRYGLSVINYYNTLFVEVPGATVTNFQAHNDSLLSQLFSFNWPAAGTPLRLGLDRTGRYFDSGQGNFGKTDPIIQSCQKNFAVLFTDGYWNGNPANRGDVDGDTYADTLADVAKYYYDKDLSPLTNDVVPDSFDSATYQHLVTYTVAFGVSGHLTDTDGDGWPNPSLTEGSDWGDPSCYNCPEKIDDLWHAAYNSKGTFISASDPGTLVTGLKSVLSNIALRDGSAASVALNSGFITSSSKIYQAIFNSDDWTGDIKAIPIGSGASLGSPLTTASANLPSANSRVIFTHDGSDGAPFRWSYLNSSQQAALNKDSAGVVDNLGTDRLDFLRGDSSNEQPSGPFRKRTSNKLGDFVNSSPIYVATPRNLYPDDFGSSAPETKYSTFVNTYQGRKAMVYAGGNDGMLHGFNASTLAEEMAFVPSAVFDHLSDLTDPLYTHKFYVDGALTIADAFFASNWHTVLVAGLNKGGQGIYALDVTKPAAFAETSTVAQDVVLWEFNDSDDADLGYTFARPAIVRMHNGKWAAVFGNGYNNTESDGNVSTTGHSVLFVVDIETGTVIRKFDTGVGSTSDPNGMTTATPADFNGDFIVDAIYAGDLYGNMWKIDVSDSNPSNWDFALKQGIKPKPLFTATDASGNPQPITTRPSIDRGLNGQGYVILFGTGRYLGIPDISDTSTQTLYGIFDDKTNAVSGRNNLIEQTIVYQSSDVRVVSQNSVSTSDSGWYLDLPDSGERSVIAPFLRNGRVIFVTTVPEPNPCAFGGYSWLMEIDSKTGAQLPSPPFDLNGDGVFDTDDMIDTDGDGKVDANAGGKRFSDQISRPAVILEQDQTTGRVSEKKVSSTSRGQVVTLGENPGKDSGRMSWQQLK
ncbi:PilC/PilY family type IV pilus protein [Thiohalobacter sp. IOR34]|uniref:pilus assembly protein n=1 Tax=Thiohalobacter sp. IOR34 TaxID=3057176 RepID=UPI0025AF3715|nr:PilC/PilY family type IV pilus protein [Thiohalobacter sp. IOR34]WJW75093.1 PilC/PilY family type IV pilus protein [Thiohalobacter sp. IOR34]